MKVIWDLKQSRLEDESLVSFFQSELIARLFVNRNIDSIEKVQDFLNPRDDVFKKFHYFSDMEKSILRVKKAIDCKERVLIWGDFDADGVTSCVLLYQVLRQLGADVIYYIPSREQEGHGLNTKSIIKFISKERVKLIITTDCGISDVDPIKIAKTFKVDTIITDHHSPHEVVPEAFAILNPKVENSIKEQASVDMIENFSYFAGVGVAFQFALGLIDFFKIQTSIDQLVVLVSIGTMADVVPILGDNRFFVKLGIEFIKSGRHFGIQKLLESSGIDVKKNFNEDSISFTIAPRINAAGRLGDVNEAFKLLCSNDNAYQIDVLVKSLNNLNIIRQDLSEKVFNEAQEMMKYQVNMGSKEAIILLGRDWHIGIIGIVASKLVEKYNRPVFLMTRDERNKLVRCSARSVDNVDIHEVISLNSEFLELFGGHRGAAGLVFDENRISFDSIKLGLNRTINEILSDSEFERIISVDAKIKPHDLTFDLILSIEKFLSPFGAMNPNVVFLMEQVELKVIRRIGSKQNHLKVIILKSGYEFECVWWNKDSIDGIVEGDIVDILFSARLNNFNGQVKLQLLIVDVKLCKYSLKNSIKKRETESIKYFDHRKKRGIEDKVSQYLLKLDSPNVFIESKALRERLSEYRDIACNMVTRRTIRKSRDLFLYDYPASEEIFRYIVEHSSARVVHFMYYENEEGIDSIMQTVLKMIRFAINHKGGFVDFDDMSVGLSLTRNFCRIACEILEMKDLIDVVEYGSNFVKVDRIRAKSVIEECIADNEIYEYIREEYDSIKNFRRLMMIGEIEDLVKM